MHRPAGQVKNYLNMFNSNADIRQSSGLLSRSEQYAQNSSMLIGARMRTIRRSDRPFNQLYAIVQSKGEAVIRIASAEILPLCFAVACSVCVSAQDSPLDRSLKDRCVSWVRSVTPGKRVDPADFCSGVIRDNENGWSSISSCGIEPPGGASEPLQNTAHPRD